MQREKGQQTTITDFFSSGHTKKKVCDVPMANPAAPKAKSVTPTDVKLGHLTIDQFETAAESPVRLCRYGVACRNIPAGCPFFHPQGMLSFSLVTHILTMLYTTYSYFPLLSQLFQPPLRLRILHFICVRYFPDNVMA